MFRCSEVAKRAGLLLDGEGGRWERFQLGLHLVLCRGCRIFVGQLRATSDLARMAGRAPEAEIGPALREALARRRAGGHRNNEQAPR